MMVSNRNAFVLHITRDDKGGWRSRSMRDKDFRLKQYAPAGGAMLAPTVTSVHQRQRHTLGQALQGHLPTSSHHGHPLTNAQAVRPVAECSKHDRLLQG